VLCGYLRFPYDPGSAAPGERLVRLSVIDAIRPHLNGSPEVGWQGCNFDFSGAVFDGASLDGARFVSGTVKFSGCRFINDGLSIRQGEFRACRLHCSGLHIEEASILDFDGAGFFEAYTDFSEIEMSSGVLSFQMTRWYAGFHSFDGIRLQGGHILFDGSVFVPGRPPGGAHRRALLSLARAS
jgi:hypothetical protein